MPQPLPDFAAILAALDAHQVRFVLIGGLAMQAQGSDYRTNDVDLFYARDKANLTALVQCLTPYQPRLRTGFDDVPFIFDTGTFKTTINLTLQTDLGAIDLLGEVAGVSSFDEVWERAMPIELYGIPVLVASLDDLIAMKQAAGRPKDQAHLLELRALRHLSDEDAA